MYVCVSSLGSGEPEEEFKDEAEEQLQMQSRGKTETRQLDVINTATSRYGQSSLSRANPNGSPHSECTLTAGWVEFVSQTDQFQTEKELRYIFIWTFRPSWLVNLSFILNKMTPDDIMYLRNTSLNIHISGENVWNSLGCQKLLR